MADGILSEREALELVAYLVSAAELSVIEPDLYGSFRLVDAASRLLTFLAERAPTARRPLYSRFREEIDRNKVLMMWDRDAYVEFVERLPRDVVERLLVRGESGSAGAAP
jgi:hypothetical protein